MSIDYQHVSKIFKNKCKNIWKCELCFVISRYESDDKLINGFQK